MNRFFKTLLLWLLVAVLPLHAVAASASMSCGPVHQQAMQVIKATDTDHHHGADAHAQHHTHHDVVNADNTSPGPHHYSNCGNCAATCVGAAAPPSGFNPGPVFDGSELVTVSPVPLVVGITPGGFERPPKRISA